MNACTRLTSWISSSLMLALIAGCGVGGGALKFNQAIVAANEKLGAAGVKYGEAIPAALNGGEQELMKLKAAYTEMTNTVASVKAEVSALTVPNDKTSQDLSTA